MIVNPVLLDHLRRPRNAGRLDPARPDVGTGTALGEGCRDRVSLQIRADGATISEARFQAFGCAGTIAVASYLTGILRGASIEGAKSLAGGPWARELDLSAGRRHCVVLAEEALEHALEDLRNKHDANAREYPCPSS